MWMFCCCLKPGRDRPFLKHRNDNTDSMSRHFLEAQGEAANDVAMARRELQRLMASPGAKKVDDLVGVEGTNHGDSPRRAECIPPRPSTVRGGNEAADGTPAVSSSWTSTFLEAARTRDGELIASQLSLTWEVAELRRAEARSARRAQEGAERAALDAEETTCRGATSSMENDERDGLTCCCSSSFEIAKQRAKRRAYDADMSRRAAEWQASDSYVRREFSKSEDPALIYQLIERDAQVARVHETNIREGWQLERIVSRELRGWGGEHSLGGATSTTGGGEGVLNHQALLREYATVPERYRVGRTLQV